MHGEPNPSTQTALTSLLSFSCRKRAETFARKLQVKLHKLGSLESESESHNQHPSSNFLMSPSEAYSWLPQGVAPTSSKNIFPAGSHHYSHNNRNNKTEFRSTRSEPTHLPSHYKNIDPDDNDTSCSGSATIYHSLSSSAVEMLADSDYFFDFDIGSPEIVEGELQDSVINQCDDLNCQDCALVVGSCQRSNNATQDDESTSVLLLANNNNNNNNNVPKVVPEMESGCVFSSPTGSTSPDNNNFGSTNVKDLNLCLGVHSDHTRAQNGSGYDDFNGYGVGCDAPAHWLSTINDHCSTPSIENCIDAGDCDCSSETSDSIYYDVDSSVCSSPKTLKSLEDIRQEDEELSLDNEGGKAVEDDETGETFEINVKGCSEPKDLSCGNNRGGCNVEATHEDENNDISKLLETNVKGRPEKLNLSSSNGGGKSSFLDNSSSEDEEEFEKKMRRCSSLKTGKTPPGTPASKKIVRFADVLGLDLADVRTFLDEIPSVPKSAYRLVSYMMGFEFIV